MGIVTEKNKRSKFEEGKGIDVHRISDCERKVGSIAGGESVRAVAVGAQRVKNSRDIGVGSLELIVDKGLTGPEALICENNCKKKDTVVTRNASKIVPFEKEREADLNAVRERKKKGEEKREKKKKSRERERSRPWMEKRAESEIEVKDDERRWR
ncbi:hypothetical protein TNCV_4808441 [Trichonephila clavipes]|nr:hypothetical protein TNCV_4808441 [Trichonephila clavipes]